jgi:predicted MPP superfamily phosphohydrolase
MNQKLTRRNFLKYYLFYTAIFTGFVFYNEAAAGYKPTKIVIEKRKIVINNLPETFNGFTIAQISDLHLGETVEPWLIQKTVDLTNKLKPDCIVITGDMANNFEYLKECFHYLNKLKAPYGVFAVTGNWEEKAIGHQKTVDAMKSKTIDLLENESVYIQKNKDCIHLAGINDDYAKGNALGKLYENVNKTTVKILLSHNPYVVANIDKAKKPIDIILSGHTHGGQVIYPIIGPVRLPTAYGLKFQSGFYTHKKTRVYVNRGIGVVHFPYRINCPPEITLFTLQKKN